MKSYEFDVFISHASEDKATFAAPLANELRRLGLAVWFDDFVLTVGDSLLSCIDAGLAKSRYGIVIFSKSFFKKKWTKDELRGLFSRETGKQKVILPIRHNISTNEMRRYSPILSDRVALRSNDGADVVAKKIVKVVRPELLEVEVQRERMDMASTGFINAARERHPGYDFAVHSGASETATTPGTIAMVNNGNSRIDVLIKDATLIREKAGLSITFNKEGAKKLFELRDTGRPQTWRAGEFIKIGSSFPLLPSGDNKTYAVMKAIPDMRRFPKRHLRLEIGSVQPIVFPFMEMCLSRAGSKEAEATIRAKDSPLEISLVFSIGDSIERTIETSFSWNFIGYSCSSCKKVIEVIDRLRNGDTFRLFDLEIDKLVTESPALADQFRTDPFPSELRQLLSVTSEAEKQFNVLVKFTNQITEEDSESLFYLDCLFNGREYGRDAEIAFTLTKDSDEIGLAKSLFLNGEPLAIFLGVSNFPGYFPLFGDRIPAPLWGLYTEKCVIEAPSESATRFMQAAKGEQVPFNVVAKSPTLVRWKSDVPVSTQFG